MHPENSLESLESLISKTQNEVGRFFLDLAESENFSVFYKVF